MTVEELDGLLATPLSIARFAAKMSKNGYDDAALAFIECALAKPEIKSVLAALLTPLFGCDGEGECPDCPPELEAYQDDFAGMAKIIEEEKSAS